jgi:hypothetical protein
VKEMRKKEMKRVQITFSIEQWELIKKLKGEMGVADSEIIRNIVIAWLVEKSFITSTLKLKLLKNGEKKGEVPRGFH